MRRSSNVATTSSPATSAAPTGTRTIRSAASVARESGVWISCLASAAVLAARVPAAFLAAVERFVAFVLRVAAALAAAVSRVVRRGVFAAVLLRVLPVVSAISASR